MNKLIKHILTVISLVAAVQTNAQTGQGSAINFSAALDMAITNDQDLQAAEFDYQSALASRGQSKSALLPQLEFSVFTRRTEQETVNSSLFPDSTSKFDTDGYSLSLTQTIYNHSIYKKLEQTDMSIAAATATVEAARQDLIVRLATAYFNVLGAEDNLKFAIAEKEAIGKQLEQSKKRFEVGLIAITDVKEAQASYDTSVAQEIDARNLHSAELEALAVILGNYTQKISPMVENIPLIIPEPANIQKWTDNALNNNLSLKAAKFNFQASQKQVDADQSEHYPYLGLSARNDYSDPDGGRFDGETTDTAITLQLTVPIYSGGLTSANHRQSVALKEKARALKVKAHRQALQQTRDAYLGVSSTIAQVKAFKQALLSSQAAYEATQAGFEVGTRTAIDVLTTLREVYRAERDHARSRYNYVINTLKLKQAAGTLTIDDGKAINSFLR